MNQFAFRIRRRYRRAIQLIGSHLYTNPNRDVRRSILVAGTGRSGTTWLADLIASQIPCRIMFEPFNPVYVPSYRGFNYFQYLKPGTENNRFYSFVQNILTGDIRNHWIDQQNERIFSKYRLIKAIRANLSLKWIHDNFPNFPIVFIIRHPCAVVLSRKEWNWATDEDIEPLLLQHNLVTDYLTDYLDLIKSSSSEEEKHAIIWSVSNLIPLKQFKPGEIKIVYYENLCTQLEIELPEVFESIGHAYNISRIKKSARPSMTTIATSAVATGGDKLTAWKKKLSSSQINRILKVVEAFGLDHLYGDSILPLNNETR